MAGDGDGAPNVYEPRWDDVSERDGFSYRDSWLGHQAGAERLGASLYEIEPGQTTFPYHWHTANEEQGGTEAARFIVVSEMNWPDPCVYPDSGKVGVRLVAPDGEGDDGRRVFIESDAVDYWHGEQPPGQ